MARRPYGGIVRILRRLSEPSGGRRWPLEGGPASLEAMGGEVHDGIGALPDGLEFYEGSPRRREAAGRLRKVARPLWRPWVAGCMTE